jgi:hypothetical protein
MTAKKTPSRAKIINNDGQAWADAFHALGHAVIRDDKWHALNDRINGGERTSDLMSDIAKHCARQR